MIYCFIPVARLTDEMIAASTTDGDRYPVTPEGRAVLGYRGEPPASAARYVTREGDEAARAWLSSRPAPETVEAHLAAVETQRRAARVALRGGR